MTDVSTIWRFLNLTDDFETVFLNVNHLFVNFEGVLKFKLKTDCYEKGTYVNGSCCGDDRVCIMWKQHKEGRREGC